MTDSELQSETPKRGLIPPILIYLVAIVALMVGIGVVCAKILLSAGVPPPVVGPLVPKAVDHKAEVAASDRIVLGNLALEVAPEKIRVLSRGSLIVEFSPPKEGSLQWLAAIRNPYAPLQMGDGTPFLSNTKAQVPIGENIGGLTGADGKFKALTEKDFPRFPFFSSTPTTMGFVFGSARSGDVQRGVTLYFIDTVTDAVATIPIPVFIFPEWLRDRGSPPPFVIRRELSLGSGAQQVSEVVATSVQGYGSGRYADDQAIRGMMAGEEFKRAFLTRDELAALKVTEFSRASEPKGKLAPALQKIIRLLWYGKMLGRGESLNALVDQLHPTIAQAIRSNQSLSPK